MDNRDWVTAIGQQGGGDGKGAMGRGRRGGGTMWRQWGKSQWGKRWGWGGRGWRLETGMGQKGGIERGKRRVDFADGYDEMLGWT